MKTNTLVLFQMVDKHGKILYDMIRNTENIGDRKVFFVHGGTDTEDRENIRKIMEEEEVNFDDDRMYLKVIVFQKIQQAIDKKKDIYYIPDFENEFSIEKLLNLKKILGENNFNVLIFYNEFRKNPEVIDDVFSNLAKFSNSQIIRDY
jgi:hypothetical protein